MKTKLMAFVALFAASTVWGFTEVSLNDYAVKDADGNLIVLGTAAGEDENRTKEAAFDGDKTTFFDPKDANLSEKWVGLEMTTPKYCTAVSYSGRDNNAVNIARMRGALIQGANTADFSDAVTLHTLNPPANWNGTDTVTESCLEVAAMSAYKYFRLYTPNKFIPTSQGGPRIQEAICAGNVSELEFLGGDADAADAVPAQPTLRYAKQINGILNLRVRGVSAVYLYEVQWKRATDDDWRVFGTFEGRTDEQNNFWFRKKGAIGVGAYYRVRAHTPGVAPSDWRDADDGKLFPASWPLLGTWIGTEGSWNNNAAATGVTAWDGNPLNYFDGPQANGVWTGQDLGTVRTVTGVRYIRRDGDANRIVGGRFQVANTADFSDATDIYTVTAQGSVLEVKEIVLDTPVEGRYVRYLSPDNGFGNIAECEFMGARHLPAPTNLAVARNDLDVQLPVLTWTPATGDDGLTAATVWRASGAGGPWTKMATVPMETATWTDETAAVGVKYWYRLASFSDADGTDFDGEFGEERVSFRRAVRLDRDASDETTLLDGVTAIEYLQATAAGYGVANVFDGDEATFADIGNENRQDTGVEFVGLRFDKPVGLAFARGLPRTEWAGRANGQIVYGSNATDAMLAERTVVSNPFTFNNVTWSMTEGVSSATFQNLIVSKPGGGGYSNFAELQFYGWYAEDVADVLQGPEALTTTVKNDGVYLTWLGCAAATSYRIERAVDNSTEWAEVGTATEATFVDTTAPYDGSACTYRVVALKGDEEAISDAVRVIPYTTGDGTGLTGVYAWPWHLNTAEAATTVWTNFDAKIDLDWGAGALIPEQADSTDYVHVTWTGKLIVPFDGTYTFSTLVDDYFTLKIDDTYLINAWGSSSANATATMTLTAGEHPIRVEFGEVTGAASCRLMWSGCVTEEVIPATQFKPEDPTDISPWEGNRTFVSTAEDGMCGAADIAGDAIRLGAAGGGFGATDNNYHYLWRTVTGNFDCRVRLKYVDTETAFWLQYMLMARRDADMASPFVSAAFATSNGSQNFHYGVKRRMTEGTAILDRTSGDPWSADSVGNDAELRLVRVGNTFTCSARPAGTARWITYDTVTFDSGVLGRTMPIGLATSGGGRKRVQPYMVEATDFSIGPAVTGFRIIVR